MNRNGHLTWNNRDEVAPAGSYTRTDEGAHIGPDGEVDWHGLYLSENRRAEKAEREVEVIAVSLRGWAKTSEKWQEAAEGWEARAEKTTAQLHDALDEQAKLIEERDEARGALRARLGVLAEPRPLTPDAITDEMVERAAKSRPGPNEWSHDIMRRALIAALTEPPARPEGAEELARLIADADVGEWDCGDLADALLATGRVRVVTEEQP